MAWYDNSSENPSNPDPSREVGWGEQTKDEMLVGYVEVARADQDLGLGSPASKKLDDGQYEVTFRYKPPAGTKEVYLAGEFNDWKPADLKMAGPDASGAFELKRTLAAGSHEYRQRARRQEMAPGPGQSPAGGDVPQQWT